MSKKQILYNFLIVTAGILFFIPFLGKVHLFDWDEINFAECAREMLVTGDYFSVKINFQPFWEKPPVFIWMQALSMKVFGVNEFAARFPNAVCGIITLLLLFNIGKKHFGYKFGFIWILVYAGSFLPHFYFKSGIIDPWFNLFIFLGIYYFILFVNHNSNNNKWLIFSALFIGIAILTKGPVAVLVFGLCFLVYWMLKRFQKIISVKQIIIYSLAVLFVGGLWFLILVISGNTEIIAEFFLYQVRLFNTQDAGHGGPFFYHWIVLLIGCFPLSVFAIRAFKKNDADTPFQKLMKQWMHVLFWVVLILFSIVKTKIVHYSSLCYFPLSFLASYSIYKIIYGEIQWKKYSSILLFLIAFVIGAAISLLPIVDKYKTKIIESDIIKDKFAVENLKANVQWWGGEWLLGLILIAGTGIMLFVISKRKYSLGITGLFILSLIVVNLSSFVITPRIEKYSQAAAIEFYEYLSDKDVYVETIGFKSYAHIFYSNKQYQENINSYDRMWLLSGEIDKPAYFVSKINEIDNIKASHPDLMELYRKNGFVFWVRNIKLN